MNASPYESKSRAAPATRFDLLAVDLDGTLLNSQHELPPENRAALHRAHEAGIRVVLCTGRSFPETAPILKDIGLDLDATVTVFGALLSDARTGQTLERRRIDLPTSFALTDWFLERDYTVLWLTDGQESGHDGYVIDAPRRHAAVDRWVQQTPCKVLAVERLDADVFAPLRISIIDDCDVLESVATDLHAAFDGRIAHNVIRAPAYELTIIEAFAAGVNKWTGIERLCRRWNIDPARTAAVGDDVNDIDLLREAGLGVAMANARPEVKQVADRLTKDNDSAGVAALIDELLQP